MATEQFGAVDLFPARKPGGHAAFNKLPGRIQWHTDPNNHSGANHQSDPGAVKEH